VKTPKYNSELLRSLVVTIRKQLPRTGGKKLYVMLQDEFIKHHISIGRDNFLDFLKAEYLQVPKVRRYYKTTNSRHWMKRYPNLISNLVLNRPEQVWVADITYLRTKEKTYYLHLLTDACSKKIVGYQLSDNLMSSTTVKALEMALINRETKNQLIHHSDRGLQYCSKEYTELLKKNNILISMTQEYDPYENAVAERVNGILKEEFGLHEIFENYQNLNKQVTQAITLYNNFRIHMSINMITPNQAHQQKIIHLKQWKKINRNRINSVTI
jgi:transposase InsO family protein